MCTYVAGKSAFDLVLLEVPIRQNWLDVVKIRIPDPDTLFLTLHELRVEYDWKPPMCSHCNVFGHSDSFCLNVIVKNDYANAAHVEKSSDVTMDNNDGFQTVTRKGSHKAMIFSLNGHSENHKMNNHSSLRAVRNLLKKQSPM